MILSNNGIIQSGKSLGGGGGGGGVDPFAANVALLLKTIAQFAQAYKD